MCDPISNYYQWIHNKMEDNKRDRIETRMQGVLAIHALNLPYDITLQLIISYKYDLKKPTYKRRYNMVMRQLILCRQRKKRSQDIPMSYWPSERQSLPL